jgi:signal transduction histidine kinase
MKAFYKASIVIVVVLTIIFYGDLLKNSSSAPVEHHVIDQIEMTWVDKFNVNISKAELEHLPDWEQYSTKKAQFNKPYGDSSQWFRIKIPELDMNTMAILFEKIYGYHVVIKYEDKILYETNRDFNYEIVKVLVPLANNGSDDYFYLGLQSKNRIGIQDQIIVGDYFQLEHVYINSSNADYILGSALIFISIIMLCCSFFLNTVHKKSWISLCVLIFSSGIIMITYSPFLYTMYEKYGKLYVALFDMSLYILLPAFTIFFESTFGQGYKSITKKLRQFQVVYFTLCIFLMIINELSNYKIYPIYRIISGNLVGFIMIVQFIILISSVVVYVVQRNKDAIIFSIGFMIFAILGVGELIWFYFKSGYYDLFLWKWGVLSFMTSLIIILGRQFAENHRRVVEYSRQLEMFNNELQRSEKMEIISELAASVAHEVRNPLQVTRGFLQLVAEKQENSDKVYLNMALDELDRASGIITDFLTFAKPEVGKNTTLNILEEFIHIEGILIPMANLQGGNITVNIPRNLFISGNSSKFKQAFVNIIKNSIESLHDEGDIQLWAYENKNRIFIHIKDNGEGMSEAVLERLGEPYFSNKTKGTGLGLMVTMRIIEVMSGTIQFKSKVGVGTEVIISFPSTVPT